MKMISSIFISSLLILVSAPEETMLPKWDPSDVTVQMHFSKGCIRSNGLYPF